jgi:TM2 domain-containing membrane protein YozV
VDLPKTEMRGTRRSTSFSLVYLVMAVGCASSPLPAPGETSFQRGQDRLRGGLAAAKVDQPPTPDQVLFMQAEAFFHYRYSSTSAGAGAYLAAAGAAALEFGPLSAAVSSEGLGDLRLHAYDGATQLYETLLQRWPQTRLRQLALYRLGWSYRNVTIGGFPRSSDAAFSELEHDPTAGHLAELATEARKVPSKSQDTALLLSVIPGAGQVYTGRVGNGIARLSIALVFATAAVLPIVLMAKNRGLSWTGTAITIGGFIGLQVVYTDSYQTALHDTMEWNERHQQEFERAHPEAP